ncbi:MAG: 50S ribosomal protein L20 [Patescibacteria group bacterium]
MTRVKRGVQQHKRRERILKQTKGFMWTRKSKIRQAKEALLHAWSHAFADRKKKKRTSRRLWQIQLNAAAREQGISYSKLIAQLKTAQIALDRKVLADIAQNHPEVFNKVLATK